MQLHIHVLFQILFKLISVIKGGSWSRRVKELFPQNKLHNILAQTKIDCMQFDAVVVRTVVYLANRHEAVK